MIKKILVIFIILGSLSLYNLKIIGRYSKLLELIAVGIMFLILVFHLVYGKQTTNKQHFRAPILLIFLAFILSTFMAYYAFNQSFAISLYEQRDIYFYSMYFVLHILNIDKKDLQKIVIYLGIVYFLAYVAQMIVFPSEIFDVTMRVERGTTRIYLKGSGYAVLAIFLCLQIYYHTLKIRYVLITLICFSTVILFGARSGIFLVVMGVAVQLILSKRIKSKAITYLTVVVAIISFFYFFQDIFSSLESVMNQTKSEGASNVRVLGAKFFLTKFLPNKLSYFTGIGEPNERSPLGQMTKLLSLKHGYYLGDIGIIGNYISYGVLFVISVFWINIKALFIKISPDLQYVKVFFFFFLLIMLPIATGFAESETIAIISILLYLLDKSNLEYLQTMSLDKRLQH
ncbi:MAG: hypothetical protein JXJ22_10255 [Bacteroidales bacterium]|nr:hypothetical protein [Bacteroidales bacterium]